MALAKWPAQGDDQASRVQVEDKSNPAALRTGTLLGAWYQYRGWLTACPSGPRIRPSLASPGRRQARLGGTTNPMCTWCLVPVRAWLRKCLSGFLVRICLEVPLEAGGPSQQSQSCDRPGLAALVVFSLERSVGKGHRRCSPSASAPDADLTQARRFHVPLCPGGDQSDRVAQHALFAWRALSDRIGTFGITESGWG